MAIVIYDTKGYVAYLNEGYKKLWRANYDELMGYNILEDSQLKSMGVMPKIRRVFGGQAAVFPDICYDPKKIGRAGRQRWIRMVAFPVKDAAGRVANVVFWEEDITSQHNRRIRMEQQIKDLAEKNRKMDERERRLVALKKKLDSFRRG